MSIIRRTMSLRIMTISSKWLKRKLLKRIKTRLKSWSLTTTIITVIMIRKTLL